MHCDKQLQTPGVSSLNRNHQMTPMTPFVESQAGRLTELVYLLSDRPLPLAHQAVLDAQAEHGDDLTGGDPWLVVAAALELLETMTEATLKADHERRRQRRAAAADQELVVT